MKYSFTTLWNITFLFTGPVWALLVWMVWDSGQLQSEMDRTIFLSVIIPGFIAIYLSGFLIESWHKKKQVRSAS